MKSYCTMNKENCDDCSLANYGRDCRNNPVRSLAQKKADKKYQASQRKKLGKTISLFLKHEDIEKADEVTKKNSCSRSDIFRAGLEKITCDNEEKSEVNYDSQID